MQKIKDDKAIEFYAYQTIEKGWSRDLLLNAIKMDTYSHAKKQLKSHNFENTLPQAQAEYAQLTWQNINCYCRKMNYKL